MGYARSPQARLQPTCSQDLAIIETSVAEARAVFQPAPFYCTAKAARRDIRSQLDREPSFTFPRVSKLHHDSVQFLVKRLEEGMVAEGVIKVLGKCYRNDNHDVLAD